MQLGLPFDHAYTPERASALPPPISAPPPPLQPGTLPEFYFVRHRRARRYIVRVDADGRVRVTIPRGGSRREAEAFARRHLEWIQRQRQRLPSGAGIWRTGTVLWFRGERLELSRCEGCQGCRAPSGAGREYRVRLAAECIRVHAPDDCRGDVQRHLRRLARRELPPRLEALAAAHGLRVVRVTVRNQRSRWGSCGRDGHICLNWRLVQMPAAVRDYVLIHELMHLKRLDHSPNFWALVAAACPGYEAARAWLRAHGRELA